MIPFLVGPDQQRGREPYKTIKYTLKPKIKKYQVGKILGIASSSLGFSSGVLPPLSTTDQISSNPSKPRASVLKFALAVSLKWVYTNCLFGLFEINCSALVGNWVLGLWFLFDSECQWLPRTISHRLWIRNRLVSISLFGFSPRFCKFIAVIWDSTTWIESIPDHESNLCVSFWRVSPNWTNIIVRARRREIEDGCRIKFSLIEWKPLIRQLGFKL